MKVIACLIFLLSSCAWADVEGIVNKQLHIREITRAEARDIYLLKERFGPYGNRPQLFRMPLRSSVHADFVRSVLGMTSTQFDKEWLKLINAGLATEIEEVKTEREMLSIVSRRPRGVGYLSKDYLVLNIKGSEAEIVRIVP
jgi:hypothetical protein